MPRFALLAHDWPAPHLDLLLESGPACWTWRLPAFPSPGQDVPAERIADHRLAYLDHQGPVSGGRGSVRRVDGGAFDLLEATPQRVVAHLRGTRCAGRIVLADGRAGFAA